MGNLTPAAKKKRSPKSKPAGKLSSAKDLATERKEPWVSIISLDVDPENLHQGAFDLDLSKFHRLPT